MKPRHYGYNIPIFDGTKSLPFQTENRLIKNDLLQLLLTVPGERVMRPTFGTLLSAMLFQPGTDNINIAELKSSIETAIRDNEPRVQTEQVVVKMDKDSQILQVKVTFKVLGQNNVDAVSSIQFKIDTGKKQIVDLSQT